MREIQIFWNIRCDFQHFLDLSCFNLPNIWIFEPILPLSLAFQKSAGNSNFQNPFCELNYFLGSEYYCTGLLCLPLYKGQTFPRKWTRPSAEFPRQVLGLHFLQRCGIASDNLWSWCKTSKICLLNFFSTSTTFAKKKFVNLTNSIAG